MAFTLPRTGNHCCSEPRAGGPRAASLVKQIMLAAVGLISILSGVGVASRLCSDILRTASLTVGLQRAAVNGTRLVLMSIWFGSLAGLGEVSIFGFQKLFPGRTCNS